VLLDPLTGAEAHIEFPVPRAVPESSYSLVGLADNNDIADLVYDGTDHLYYATLLTPVPEPASLSVLAVTASAFLLRRRRQV